MAAVKVLLTGHRGRIGHVVDEVLREAGYDVRGYDIQDGDDILDFDALLDAAQGSRFVVHLAAILRTPSDALMLGGNVTGTWNVLKAAAAVQADRVVSFSSVNAMGIFMGERSPDYFPIDAAHPCYPSRPYGMSKFVGEGMCEVFTRRTGIATICIRPPAVWDDERIAAIRAERKQDESREWTPYWEYGCFVYVRDLARAVACALECDDPGHVRIVVCADDIASERMTALELAAKLEPKVPWRARSLHEREPFRTMVDNSPAKEALGWQPSCRWRPL
jgi:UDP-glucose 4-epimerase